MKERYDLLVIGAGPGGYVAAIEAAKEGKKVGIIEQDQVGGTCLNRGCIPAKAMLHAAEVYQEAKNADRFGIHCADVLVDYAGILSYKEEITDSLVKGVTQLLKANQISVLKGKGKLLPDRNVEVASDEGTQVYAAENVLLSVGSKPALIPIPGMDLNGVLTSDELFLLKELPDSLVIIGGGVISVEFATAFSGLGSKVTILEAMPRLLPGMDREISNNVKLLLKKRGVEIHTDAAVQAVERKEDHLVCRFSEKGEALSAAGTYVLCAVGRAPNTEGLFQEGAVPEMKKGNVLVDDQFQTSLPGVYAIGDMTGKSQLAHAASAQGIVTARYLAGKKPGIDLNVIPACVYTDPEIAAVGLTEEEAKEAGIPVRTGKFLMGANGRSQITKEERGFIKILSDLQTDEILGAQMMCARATDMIGEFVTAMTNHMTVSDLTKSIRPHPTYNEGIGEALEELSGGAIHIMPRKRR